RTAEPAFISATCTAPLKPVARLPKASRLSTTTAGEIGWPATVVLGCVRNDSEAAAAGVMSNPLLVAELSAPELATSVYPVPTLSMDRLENVATPPDAAALAVPESVPPPGLLPMATLTVAEDEVTRFPNASTTRTVTAGL